MSDTISISASACAIFCSDEIWGLCPKRKDILEVFGRIQCELIEDGEDIRSWGREAVGFGWFVVFVTVMGKGDDVA